MLPHEFDKVGVRPLRRQEILKRYVAPVLQSNDVSHLSDASLVEYLRFAKENTDNAALLKGSWIVGRDGTRARASAFSISGEYDTDLEDLEREMPALFLDRQLVSAQYLQGDRELWASFLLQLGATMFFSPDADPERDAGELFLWKFPSQAQVHPHLYLYMCSVVCAVLPSASSLPWLCAQA